MLQKVRLHGTSIELEWKPKTTPTQIANNMGAEKGEFSKIVGNELQDRRYAKNDIHNIFNGSFPGTIPVEINLLVNDEIVGTTIWWLTTYRDES